MPELESSLEAFLQKRVRLLGGYSVKLAPMEAGVPDRLVIFPGGRMFLVELKTETGRLSLVQRVWHNRMLETYNVRVHTIYGREGIVKWLRNVAGSLDPKSKPGPKPRRRVG